MPIDSGFPLPDPPPYADSGQDEVLASGMPLPIGQVVSDAFGMFFKNLPSYSGIIIVVYLPLIIWTIYLHFNAADLVESQFMSEEGLQRFVLVTLATAGLSLLFQPLATGAIIFAVFRAKKGESASFGRALAVAFSRILPLIGVALATGLLMGLAVGVPVFLGAMFSAAGGFGALLGMLLVVAGLVVGVRLFCGLYVASPAVVVERVGVNESIRRSFNLTRGSRWRVFGVILLVGVAQFIVELIVGVVAEEGPGLGLVFELISMIAFAAITAVASASCYFYLKVREGADMDELASVFD